MKETASEEDWKVDIMAGGAAAERLSAVDEALQRANVLFGAQGAEVWGSAPAGAARGAGRFMDWLTAGRHAGMAYLEQTAWKRMDPRLVLPGCRTVLVGAWPTGRRYQEQEPGMGKVAAYVGEADYHDVIGEKLKTIAAGLSEHFPGEVFQPTVDTGPVLERAWAVQAGLGWLGKNRMLIHPRKGSYLLLGVVLTTADLPATGAFRMDHCGHCTRCLDACPTQALSMETGLDANKCLSYWNIEHKGDFGEQTPPPEEWQGWVYGCDICQEVCPYNRSVEEAPGAAAWPLETLAQGEAGVPDYLRRGEEGLRRNARWLLEDRPPVE